MTTPTVAELHVDRYLTNFSLAYTQDEMNFVSGAASSVISVEKQSDKYVQYVKDDFWRDEAKPRPLGAAPHQVGYRTTSDSYIAEEYGLEHTVDDRQRANTDQPIRLDEAATRLLTEMHMIRRDRVWAQSFFTTGKFTGDQTGVSSGPGANQFLQFDQSGSDPQDVIDKQRDVIQQRTGRLPNVVVMGPEVFRILKRHSSIQEVIKFTQRGVATPELLAALFNVDRVVIPRSVYNSAAEGATASFEWISDSKAMLLAYIDPNPTVDSLTAIATFAWTGLIAGSTNAIGGVIERGRDARAHSDYFQMRMAWDMKLVAADLGVFFDAAVG